VQSWLCLRAAGAVELRNALSQAFAIELLATVTFDHPTPAALAAHILQSVQPEQRTMSLRSASLASWDAGSSMTVGARQLEYAAPFPRPWQDCCAVATAGHSLAPPAT
jgi:Phosphopantetheine attachment site